MDFHEERLRFDWQTGIKARDNGTPNAALIQAEPTRSTRDYIGNGQIHIYDSETRELLSRLEAFIQVNFFLVHKGVEKEIASNTEERRVGKEGDMTCSTEWSRNHYKQ